MLDGILRWLRHEPPDPSEVPPGHRYYAVGDIHGRADLLEEMHDLIAAREREGLAAPKRTIVYLGDYVDRGLQSKEVLDLLIASEMGSAERIYLRGNHDDIFERFLNGEDVGEHWFQNGGDMTALSYGVAVPARGRSSLDWDSLRAELRTAVPDSHKEFLSRLDLHHRAGGYLFVHAGIRPGIALDEQEIQDLLWIREPFLSTRERLPAMVVHGHSPAGSPEVREHRIGIDTAAYASNRLTCVILEGATRRFISTGSARTAPPIK